MITDAELAEWTALCDADKRAAWGDEREANALLHSARTSLPRLIAEVRAQRIELLAREMTNESLAVANANIQSELCEGAALDFISALQKAKAGLKRWAGKPHNSKWWRRIDGTPIPNDLIVCIAEEFSNAPTTDD